MNIDYACVKTMKYRILPVNSHDYYEFQLEIVRRLTEILISKLHVKHKFMVFNLVLCDDYLSAATI